MVPLAQDGQSLLPVFSGIAALVAVGVAIAIEMVLERAIVLSQKLLGLAAFSQLEPTMWIVLAKGPTHQLEAFINDRSIGPNQDRNGGFG